MLPLFVWSQGNPLFSTEEVTDTVIIDTSSVTLIDNVVSENNEPKITTSWINSFIKKNARFQNKIRTEFAQLGSDYNTTKSMGSLFLIFLLAFLYGIFHSLGPGHGKVFIFSYILTEKPKVLQAIGVSYLVAFVHALSGLAISLVLIYALKEFSLFSYSGTQAPEIISQVSYGLLLLIGLFLLFQAVRKKHHTHSHSLEKKKLIPFILSIGIVPCPGTMILVTFLASMGLIGVGVFSVLFIVLGMGLTISVISIISLFSKKVVVKIANRESKSVEKLHKSFSIIGSSLLILFAVLFLLT